MQHAAKCIIWKWTYCIFHIVWFCVKQVWWVQWPAVIASPWNLACLKGLCQLAWVRQAKVQTATHRNLQFEDPPELSRTRDVNGCGHFASFQFPGVGHCPKIAWTNYNHLYNLPAQNNPPPPLDALVPKISQLFLIFFWRVVVQLAVLTGMLQMFVEALPLYVLHVCVYIYT